MVDVPDGVMLGIGEIDSPIVSHRQILAVDSPNDHPHLALRRVGRNMIAFTRIKEPIRAERQSARTLNGTTGMLLESRNLPRGGDLQDTLLEKIVEENTSTCVRSDTCNPIPL